MHTTANEQNPSGMSGLRVGLLSLEPWDEVWRRNQHFAARLVANGVIDSLVFVTPPAGGLALRARRHRPLQGVEVVIPPLILPRRYGGHHALSLWLRRTLADVDLLWINDPVAGVGAVRAGHPAVYDVTDDWREMPQHPRQRRRLVDAEDQLAGSASTVVCSNVLAQRWMSRYGVPAAVIQNGVDGAAIRAASRTPLSGLAPHAVYVGTLHANRFDVDLASELADTFAGTIHLVGPDYLDSSARGRLQSRGVFLHGPVPAGDVPSWLVSADLLICPHVVDDFTLSLDAIKSYEYLATDRPIVATRSSGFQSLSAPGLVVTDRSGFVGAIDAANYLPHARKVTADWNERAANFGAILEAAVPGAAARAPPPV